MKTIHLTLAMLFVSVSLFAQKPEITKLRNYDKIEVTSAFNVDFVVSDTYGVQCSNPALIGEQIRVDGNKLIIQEKKDTPKKIADENSKCKITIYGPGLKEIGVSGAGTLRSKDILRMDEMNIGLSGAADLFLHLEVGKLSLVISGASDTKLAGNCEHLKVITSGASDGKLFDLKCKKVNATISGASNIQVSTEILDVIASGASDVQYDKDRIKTINKSTSGSSRIVAN